VSAGGVAERAAEQKIKNIRMGLHFHLSIIADLMPISSSDEDIRDTFCQIVLEDKGYLKSHMGGSTEERGGREKRIYEMTRSGIKALSETRELRNGMWQQMPSIVWEGRRS
jgi:hypothetical protein